MINNTEFEKKRMKRWYRPLGEVKRISVKRLKEENVKLKKKTELSDKDPLLTNIYNFRGFKEVATKELEVAKRKQETASIILLDLNKFKDINDALGHLEGDNVLKIFTEKALSVLRTGDVFGRWKEGDEFIIFTNSNAEIAKRVADRIKGEFEKAKKDYPKYENFIFSVSAGIAEIGEFYDEKEKTIKRENILEIDSEILIEKASLVADKKMYEDKAKYHEMHEK